MPLALPRLYVILDAGLLRQPAGELTEQLIAAGVRLFQYRAKDAPARQTLEISSGLAKLARKQGAIFFVNDRPDLAYLAGAHGVHVGQEDLSPEQARLVLGQDHWVGVSTHNLQQFQRAVASSSDYVAIGPIFDTTSKANPDPVVGIDLLRRLRPLTRKPIVAIGGIRLQNAVQVIQAGADSVAVISDILCAPDPAAHAASFVQRLQAVNPPANL